MNSKEISGTIITIIGIILLAYAFIVGGVHGHIGNGKAFTSDDLAAIIGWFFIIGGPALWFGEVPVTIRKKIGSQETTPKEGEKA